MKKILSIVYMVGIHALLLIVLTKSNFIEKVELKLGITEPPLTEPPLTGHSYYMDALGRYYSNRSNTIVGGDGIVFIGDSITNGLSVETIFDAVNYGISGDSVKNAKERVKKYNHLEEKTIIIALGVNDIPRKNDAIASDYRALLENLPSSSLVLVSSVLPLDEPRFKNHWKSKKKNHQIEELNHRLENLASEFPNACYIDSAKYMRDASGALPESFHIILPLKN